MRSYRVPVVCLLTALASTACKGGASQAPATYQYRHLETTGITDEVCISGAWHAVMFSDRSTATAVKSLRNLDSSNNRDPILLVGVLAGAVQRTPSAPDRATSEPYQAFELRSWHASPTGETQCR